MKKLILFALVATAAPALAGDPDGGSCIDPYGRCVPTVAGSADANGGDAGPCIDPWGRCPG